jgi:hypothetical protein
MNDLLNDVNDKFYKLSTNKEYCDSVYDDDDDDDWW